MIRKDWKPMLVCVVLAFAIFYEWHSQVQQASRWGNCHIVNNTGRDILVCP